MATKVLDIRNPDDVTSTYNQIEIRGSANADMSSPTTLTSSLSIDTTTANDLSPGYSSYVDTTGYAYYQFRYKNSLNAATSEWSDIFTVDTTVMHTRFRRRMRDTNSANYYFTDADVTNLLSNAIKKLWPNTWNESIDETLTTDSATRKYNFPVGVNRVNEIEYVDSSGDAVGKPKRYKIRARQIIFDSPPPDGYTLRLYCDKMFLKLAECPPHLDDLILDLMTLDAYQTFHAHRSTFYKYTTVTNPEGGNLPSITEMMKTLAIATKDRLNSIRRVRRASSIKLTN